MFAIIIITTFDVALLSFNYHINRDFDISNFFRY